MNVGEKVLEIDDRIHNDLPRAVIGYVSTPVDTIETGADGSEVILGNDQVLLIAAFAQCVNVRVLAEEQIVVCYSLFAGRKGSVLRFNCQNFIKQVGLVIPGLLVIDRAEVDKPSLFVQQRIHFTKNKPR